MSWVVHSTVDEPIELLSAFVAHYLAIGASEIHLCLDRRNEEALDVLGPLKEVKITICDEAYWSASERGQRPISQADRQVTNLRRAYNSSKHDWLLFCDADEFLYIDPFFKNVAHLLDSFSDTTNFHLFPPAERFYRQDSNPKNIFDGLYRFRNKKVLEIGSEIYGADWRFFSRGLLQDGPGKSIMRVGCDLDVNIHAPKNGFTDKIRNREVKEAIEQSFILHYDGLTPLHWALKLCRWYASMVDLLGDDPALIRKRRTAGRNQQAEALHQNRSDPKALKNMMRLQFLGNEQIHRLDEARSILWIDPRINENTEKIIQNATPDLRQEVFDKKLLILHEDFIKRSGFQL